ncbi:MAG: DoxX family protein [Deltaproteobacteria bacterium]
MKNTFDLMARVFIAILFYYEALDSFWYFEKTKETMSIYGLTWRQDLLLSLTIAALIIGATLVLIGYYSNFGAFLLLLYIVPTTFIIFSFWNDPVVVRRIQMINFMRNLAIIGALLLLIVNKPGSYSVKSLIYTLRLPS